MSAASLWGRRRAEEGSQAICLRTARGTGLEILASGNRPLVSRSWGNKLFKWHALATARLQQGAVIGQRASNDGKRKWTGHYVADLAIAL